MTQVYSDAILEWLLDITIGRVFRDVYQIVIRGIAP